MGGGVRRANCACLAIGAPFWRQILFSTTVNFSPDRRAIIRATLVGGGHGARVFLDRNFATRRRRLARPKTEKSKNNNKNTAGGGCDVRGKPYRVVAAAGTSRGGRTREIEIPDRSARRTDKTARSHRRRRRLIVACGDCFASIGKQHSPARDSHPKPRYPVFI